MQVNRHAFSVSNDQQAACTFSALHFAFIFREISSFCFLMVEMSIAIKQLYQGHNDRTRHKQERLHSVSTGRLSVSHVGGKMLGLVLFCCCFIIMHFNTDIRLRGDELLLRLFCAWDSTVQATGASKA